MSDAIKRGRGRPLGAKNKQKAIETEVRASGITPLEYMLSVMQDNDADRRRRDDMAKAAAPYVHAKFSNIEHSGPGGGPMVVEVMQFADTNTGEQLATAPTPTQAVDVPTERRDAGDRDSA